MCCVVSTVWRYFVLISTKYNSPESICNFSSMLSRNSGPVGILHNDLTGRGACAIFCRNIFTQCLCYLYVLLFKI